VGEHAGDVQPAASARRAEGRCGARLVSYGEACRIQTKPALETYKRDSSPSSSSSLKATFGFPMDSYTSSSRQYFASSFK
jgi:hypothetical protein